MRRVVMILSKVIVIVLLVILIANISARNVQLPEENNYLSAPNIDISESRYLENTDYDLYQVSFAVGAVAYMADDVDLYYYEVDDRAVVSARGSFELTNLRYLASSEEIETRAQEETVEAFSEVAGEELSEECEVPLWRTLPYLIHVSLDSFTIAILGLDENGYHTELLHTFHTAFGRTNAQTRPGTYEILSKSTWIPWRNGLFSPYGSRYVGNLWFHGPLYSRRNLNTMRANTFNQIGTRATAGCFRTSTYAAAWIYHNAPIGTRVVVSNDSFFTSPVPERIDRRQTFDPTYPLQMTPRVDTPMIEYEVNNGRCG